MIDTVRLNIKAGDGGNGCISFLREKFRPKGGPDGGDGGDGGSVYLAGDSSINTLLHLKFNSTIYAQRGTHGKGKDMRGANGEDTILNVPLGTVVWQMLAKGEKEFLADIVSNEPVLVAQGGKGGWGNAHYVSATNQEPMLAQRGEAGEYVVLFLELKLLADVGLLAKPNAGKSTLISRCSAARPRIADYPFTTVEPVLGVVTSRGRDFVMMEVPGLLEGAHEGVGLGHQFLRHAERARVYVHLIDGLSDDPVRDFHLINQEVAQFNPTLLNKPQIVAVNKVDVTEVRELREVIEEELRKEVDRVFPPRPDVPATPIFFISAVTGEGIDAMLGKIVELLDSIPAQQSEAAMPQRQVIRPRKTRGPDSVRMEKGVYVVESEEMERLVALSDTREYRVLLQLWRELNRRGLAQLMEDAGIEPGDTVRIGKVELEWF